MKKPKLIDRWEYHVVHINGGPMSRGELNKYGEDGWELCAICSTPAPPPSLSHAWPSVCAYTFKRKIPGA